MMQFPRNVLEPKFVLILKGEWWSQTLSSAKDCPWTAGWEPLLEMLVQGEVALNQRKTGEV